MILQSQYTPAQKFIMAACLVIYAFCAIVLWTTP